MKTRSLRLAKPEDAKNYAEWLNADAKINYVDPKTVMYRSALTAVVEEDGEPVLMQTAHPVLMLEALAPKPGITPKQSARAIWEIFEGFKRVAQSYGIKEIYFASSFEPLQKMVEKKSHKKHGITRVTLPVFRCKL